MITMYDAVWIFLWVYCDRHGMKSDIGSHVSSSCTDVYRRLGSAGGTVTAYLKKHQPQLVEAASTLAASAATQIGHATVVARTQGGDLVAKVATYARHSILDPAIHALSQQMNKTRPPLPVCPTDEVTVNGVVKLPV
mmetsp:Transcript_60699/g.127199  ORF Transcript_60699/g.127199 Transcript_60699/m.127199 type:complete len:137 (+) Transcript_60699:583-993(+)